VGVAEGGEGVVSCGAAIGGELKFILETSTIEITAFTWRGGVR